MRKAGSEGEPADHRASDYRHRKATGLVLYTDSPVRIDAPGTFPFASAIDAQYTVGRDFVFDAMADVFRRTRTISADIETFGLGLDALRIKSVGMGDDRHAVVFDPRDKPQAEMVKHSFDWAESIIFFNSTYDVPSLWLNGLITLEQIKKIVDPLLWCRLAEPGNESKDLYSSAQRHIALTGDNQLLRAFKALGLSKKAGFYQFDLDRPIFLQGAASDPLVTWRLAPAAREAAYRRQTQGHPFSVYGVTGDEAWALVDREQIINRMLLRRSCIGFLVDFEYLDKYRAENAQDIREAEKALQAEGIRPGVAADLMKRLDALGVVPPDHPRTPTGALSGDKRARARISHPLAKTFTHHAQVKRVGDVYLEKCVTLADKNGRIHPAVNLLLAATGRTSMSDPPIQQFSGPARGIILADPGDSLTSIDWSQIEPVIMANIAGDMDVLQGYEAGTNDVYTSLGIMTGMLPPGTTAQDCERDKSLKAIRSILKVVILAQMYGEGLPKLSADLGLPIGPFTLPTEWEIEVRKVAPDQLVPRYGEAVKYRKAVFQAMPKCEDLIKRLKDIAKTYKMIFTVSGRIAPIPMSKKYGYWAVETHKGVNYTCQGGAYDTLADALVEVDKAGLGDAMYLTMHDECVVSTEAAPDIRKIMQKPSERLCFLAERTPVLRTDMTLLGERWGSA